MRSGTVAWGRGDTDGGPMARGRFAVVRILSAASAVGLTAGLLVASAGTATASTAVGTRSLLQSIPVAAEHRGGYSAAAFGPWRDADGDGCATPQEVMIRDALTAPQVLSGCTLVGGRGRRTTTGRSSPTPRSCESTSWSRA